MRVCLMMCSFTMTEGKIDKENACDEFGKDSSYMYEDKGEEVGVFDDDIINNDKSQQPEYILICLRVKKKRLVSCSCKWCITER